MVVMFKYLQEIFVAFEVVKYILFIYYCSWMYTNSTLLRLVLVRLQFALFENNAKNNLRYFRTIADIWQGCEYALDPEYISVLSMALVLNMPGFWICQGYEYSNVLIIPRLDKLLNVSEYSWIFVEYAWFCLNKPEFWAIIQPCDRSPKGHNFSCYKILRERICIILVKGCIVDVGRVVNRRDVLNKPGF